MGDSKPEQRTESEDGDQRVACNDRLNGTVEDSSQSATRQEPACNGRPLDETDIPDCPSLLTADQESKTDLDGDFLRHQLTKYQENLTEKIEPQFGLVDVLVAEEVLTRSEADVVDSKKIPDKQNKVILKMVLKKTESQDLLKRFVDALAADGQQHVVNHILDKADVNQTDDRPLTEEELWRIDKNLPKVARDMDPDEVVTYLLSAGCIKDNQKERILSHGILTYEKNRELLKVLRRRSYRDFQTFINILETKVNQPHVAKVLAGGGVIMPAKASVLPQASSKEPGDKDVKNTDTALIQRIRYYLNNASKKELDQIHELVQLKREGFELVGANDGSVELLFWCRDQSGLKRLHEWLVNFRVLNIVKSLFNRLLKTGPENKLNVVVTWSEDDYAECEEYFNRWKKNQPVKRAYEGAASKDDGDDDPAPKQPKLTTATECPLDETDATAETGYDVSLPFPPADDSEINRLPLTVREEYLLRAFAQLFNIQQQTTAKPDVAFLYKQLASVSFSWLFEFARKGFKRRVRDLIESQCGPYLRTWKRVERLYSTTEGARVRGVAYLNDLIYVVYSQQNRIAVYKVQPRVAALGSMRIEDMRFPLDIVASEIGRCLYVLDWAGGQGEGGKIWRIQGNPLAFEASVCIRGLVSPRKLSLTVDNNLLIVSGNQLVTYRLARNNDAPDTALEIVSDVMLPKDTEPQHAVATRFGTYLIGHGQSTDVPHRIIELSRDGKSIIRSYGGPVSGSEVGMLSWPAHVCLGDGDGRVILADCDNDRVLMFTSSLKLERVVLDRDTHNIEKPRRLCYVSKFGWLLVGADFGIVDVYQIRR